MPRDVYHILAYINYNAFINYTTRGQNEINNTEINNVFSNV